MNTGARPTPKPSDGRDPYATTMVILAAIYASLVVYGSLVPLDFHRREILDAWRAFREMPYLDLGPESRADWVANLLLYIPLALFMQGAFAGARRPRFARVLGAIATVATCCALAAAVEFTQLFFPPRTVSLNDLVAEAIGSAVGLLMGFLWGDALRRKFLAASSGGSIARRAALGLYALAYFVFSVFPLDFVISVSELSTKLAGGGVGWILAPAGRCSAVTVCTLKSLVEIAGFAPFGVLLAMGAAPRRGDLIRSFLLGAACGLAIEIIQIFVESGISQGLSVFTRGAGAAAGTALYRALQARAFKLNRSLSRGIVVLAVPFYLLAVSYVSGWLSSQWGSNEYALARIPDINWLPFYYHYYTTETHATLSLLLSAALYGSIGVAAWIWSPDAPQSAGLWKAAALAAGLASVMEVGKLYLPSTHPDPTNILIAAMAAPIALALCRILAKSVLSPTHLTMTSPIREVLPSLAPSTPHVEADVPPRGAAVDGQGSAWSQEIDRAVKARESAAPLSARTRARLHGAASMYVLQIAILCIVGYSIIEFPFPIPLAIFIAAYLLLLSRYPESWPIVVLAALPVLDLAHWSGRIFWDEFDVLVLATIAGVAPKLRFRSRGVPATFAISMAAVALSYVVSLGVGLFPLSPLDENAFTNYYSHFASLRLFKGVAWGVALLLLVNGDERPPSVQMRSFAWGMAIGVALEVAFVLWERLSFSGIFNFTTDYRVTGTFSTMHTGGAYIEAYLTASIPFVVYLAISTRTRIVRASSSLVLLAATYALMVTYSRGGYAALAIAGIVLVLGALIGAASRFLQLRTLVLIGLVVCVASAIAIPIWSGPYMKERFATVNTDLAVRTSHWSDSLEFRDPGVLSRLFGMGLGSYPEAYFWRNHEGVTPSTYRFGAEGGNAFLRLSSGDSLYFEQLVPVAPNTEYELSFDARPVNGRPALTVPVCEKWMLASFRCAWNSFDLAVAPLEWRHFSVRFNSKDLGAGWKIARRPVKLSMFESGPNAVLDVDNVRLTGLSGDLVRNGGFDGGMDHWFFSTDNHLPWHIKNLWVHLLFEQGWLGVATVGLLTLATICFLGTAMFAGEYFAATLLASVLALLTVGMVDSLIDSPRHLLLLTLLLGLGWLLIRGKEGERQSVTLS